tara:strand:- start:546 stop:1118 length:573 start_codon:yes stop_codon:yes gene_type:complete
MVNIVIFGKPGAGKGTQAEFLRSKYNLIHISTGDLFRYHMINKTPLGLKVTSILENGDLVPDKLTIEILENEVNKYKKTSGFIFDGFPRTINQAKKLDKFLNSLSMQINFTIALEAEDEILLHRLLKRGETSGRSDDTNKEKILNRFREYNEKTLPLKEFYTKQNKFFSINGVGDINVISQRLISIIENN